MRGSSARRRSDPARRRIARIRWTTTVVFAAATAACLGVLVAAALHIDLASRAEGTDTDLRQRVETLADLVTFGDDQQLNLGPVQQSHAAQSVPVYGFVTDTAIAYAQPAQDALPSDAVLRRALADARHENGVVTFVAPEAASPDGVRLHWAAATISDFGTYVDGTYTGGIAVAGKPVAAAAGHTQLRTGLLLAAGALTVFAAALAHLVSGLAVRPAVRGLEAQEQFLVEAAHELRTPLAALRVLAERRAPPDQTIRQVDRLVTLSDRLLLRARSASASVVSTGPVRLDQVVEAAVIMYLDRDATACDLDVDLAPTTVDADPDLVDQVVQNLLTNADRHGAPPIRVRVSAGTLTIADAGPGIPARDRRRALRAGSTGGAGTGTGLAIVQWASRVQRATLSLADTDPRDRERPGLRVTIRFRTPRRTASSKPHTPRRIVDAGRQEGA